MRGDIVADICGHDPDNTLNRRDDVAAPEVQLSGAQCKLGGFLGNLRIQHIKAGYGFQVTVGTRFFDGAA
ncbi:hypothetical protein D3C80_2135710 [compost metagenome]